MSWSHCTFHRIRLQFKEEHNPSTNTNALINPDLPAKSNWNRTPTQTERLRSKHLIVDRSDRRNRRGRASYVNPIRPFTDLSDLEVLPRGRYLWSISERESGLGPTIPSGKAAILPTRRGRTLKFSCTGKGREIGLWDTSLRAIVAEVEGWRCRRRKRRR